MRLQKGLEFASQAGLAGQLALERLAPALGRKVADTVEQLAQPGPAFVGHQLLPVGVFDRRGF